MLEGLCILAFLTTLVILLGIAALAGAAVSMNMSDPYP